MPKRNLLLLALITAISLVAWLARDYGRPARQVAEVVAAIDRAYFEPVDPADLTAAALDGVMTRLDRHSALVDGAARRELEATLDQEFGGVGLELSPSPEGVTVHSPVAGGPAARAGIEAGDVIVSIDGVDVRRLSVRDAVEILRGDPGSSVIVGVRRPAEAQGVDGTAAGAEIRTLSLTRELVRTESVLGDRRRPDGSWEWIVEGEPGIGVVRITSFGDRTPAEIDLALAAIAGTPGLRGLVLDLRGNPGGLLAAAVDVCDRFLDEGMIVATRRRAATGVIVEPRRATPGSMLAGVPIAVLIDGLTASAAEIVAACLQDHGRAVVIGSRSFGKGTVQSILPLSDGRRLLKLTTAEYLRPREVGTEPHETDTAWGVSPDDGRTIDVTGRTLAALQAWRRPRDAAAAAARKPGADEPGSLGDLPRFVDPVLAAALGALSSPGAAHLRGEEETPRDADEAGPAGVAAGPDEGVGG